MNNNMQVAHKPRFSVAITTPAYQKLINSTIQDPQRAAQFVAAITSAVAVNPALQDCEASSIIAGALLGESMKLSPSPQLGQYYLVPFKQKAKYKDGVMIQPETTKATFIIGYKGLIQLAIRSGQYRRLNVMEIKAGELKRYDPFFEDFDIQLVEDFDQRQSLPTVGYLAMFEYMNGFRKTLYWTKEKMLAHADHYSKAFSRKAYQDLLDGKIPQKEMWKYSSFWYTDFDSMACKTMLRQLISKWGIMSIDMQKAFEVDDKAAEMDDKGEIFTEDPVLDFPEPDTGFDEPEETPEAPEHSKRGRKPKESPPPAMEPDEGFEKLSLEDL